MPNIEQITAYRVYGQIVDRQRLQTMCDNTLGNLIDHVIEGTPADHHAVRLKIFDRIMADPRDIINLAKHFENFLEALDKPTDQSGN